MSAAVRAEKNDGGDLRIKTSSGETFITATQRPDGTWRKARRVKDGFIPQDEQPKYQNRQQAAAVSSRTSVGISPRNLATSARPKKPIAAVETDKVCITPKDHFQRKIDLAQKKVDEIEEMEKKVASGELVPLPNQKTKIARKDEYLKKIEEITKEMEKL